MTRVFTKRRPARHIVLVAEFRCRSISVNVFLTLICAKWTLIRDDSSFCVTVVGYLEFWTRCIESTFFAILNLSTCFLDSILASPQVFSEPPPHCESKVSVTLKHCMKVCGVSQQCFFIWSSVTQDVAAAPGALRPGSPGAAKCRTS